MVVEIILSVAAYRFDEMRRALCTLSACRSSSNGAARAASTRRSLRISASRAGGTVPKHWVGKCCRRDTTGKTPADLRKRVSSPFRKNISLSESTKL
jgi:hypothetical protein